MRYNRTAILLLLVTSLSHAQNAVPTEHELIQQLAQQVMALQEKVVALEARLPAVAPSSNADLTPQSVTPPAPQVVENDSSRVARLSMARFWRG
jgi:Tfp pilus assembly protein FimV